MKDSPWPDLRQRFYDAAVVYPACALNYACGPQPFSWPPLIGGPDFTADKRPYMAQRMPSYVERRGEEKPMQYCFCLVCFHLDTHYSHAIQLFWELAVKAGSHVRDEAALPVRPDHRANGNHAIALWEATLVNKLRERQSPFVQKPNEYWSIRNPFYTSAQIIEDFMPERLTAPTAMKPKPKSPRKKRRKRSQEKRDATPNQKETVSMVFACNRNFADAARRMGKDPKTVREAYYAGLENLDLPDMKFRHGTQAMPTDRRGQGDIASHDEGPASIGPRVRVRRDQRR